MSLRGCIVMAVSAVACLAAVSADAAPEGAYEPFGDSVAVVEADVCWADPIRGRETPVRLFIPQDASAYPRCPVIVFSDPGSPGGGSLADLVDYLASRGYLCAVLEHRGLPDDARRAVRSADVSFALDNLLARDQSHPLLRGRIDRANVGVAGCGEGACAVLDLAGRTVPDADGRSRSLRDMRIRAAAAIAPRLTAEEAGTDFAWNRIRIPVMTVGGESEAGAGPGNGCWGQDPFAGMPGGHKYHLSLRGAHSAAGEPSAPDAWWRGLDGGSRDCALRTVLAFFDDHLRDSRSAEDWLDSDREPGASGIRGRLLRK